MSRPILYTYFKVLSFKCEKGFAKNIFKKIPQPIPTGENDFQLELLSACSALKWLTLRYTDDFKGGSQPFGIEKLHVRYVGRVIFHDSPQRAQRSSRVFPGKPCTWEAP